MRILFLSRWFPYPPDNGSKIRIFNILKQLARRHEIVLLAFSEETDRVDGGNIRALREYCAAVRVLPYRRFRPTSGPAMVGLLSGRPRYLVDTYSAAMAATIADELAGKECDLLVASQLDMVPYAVAARGVPAVLEELELATFRDAARQKGSLSTRLRSLLRWWKLSRYLRRVLPRFAVCTVASETERLHLRAAAPDFARVEVIPNAVDCAAYRADYGPPQPGSLVYAGALTYSANYDAVRDFLSAIYPRIARAVPGVSIRITGDRAGVDLDALPRQPGVEFTGHVPDIRPVVARSWLSVVPLRFGGGTRLKILESMALGTPVVATAKGAEGLDVTDGEDILIADGDESFAEKASVLLQSAEARRRLAHAGRLLVEAKYDWHVVGEGLCSLVERATAAGEARWQSEVWPHSRRGEAVAGSVGGSG